MKPLPILMLLALVLGALALPPAVQARDAEMEEHREEAFGPFRPPLPEALDEMIEVAMHESPMVQRAEAELQAAMAEVRQTRLELIQEITALYFERTQLGRHIQAAAAEMGGEGKEPPLEMAIEMQRIETRLRGLLGIGIPGPEPMGHRPPEAHEMMHQFPQERPPFSEDMAAGLDRVVSFELEGDLGDLRQLLSEEYGLNIVFSMEADEGMPLKLRLREQPLRGVLEAAADKYGYLCFVERDYGLLLTERGQAERLRGATIPGDIPFIAREIP